MTTVQEKECVGEAKQESTNENIGSMESSSSRSLSDCVKSLVHLEYALTSTLESTQALLQLATPKCQSEVDHVLAMARLYSTKTSAPPGWSPSLPVLHFSTPNPLPHQLRRGNLSMMELDMIRQEKRARMDHKRKRIQQDEVKAEKLKLEQEQQMKREAKDPKKKELHVHYKMEDESERDVILDRKEKLGEKQNVSMDQTHAVIHSVLKDAQTKASAIPSSSSAAAVMSMNLSDSESSTSSSSSDLEEDGEEEE